MGALMKKAEFRVTMLPAEMPDAVASRFVKTVREVIPAAGKSSLAKGYPPVR